MGMHAVYMFYGLNANDLCGSMNTREPLAPFLQRQMDTGTTTIRYAFSFYCCWESEATNCARSLAGSESRILWKPSMTPRWLEPAHETMLFAQ